MPHGNLVRKRSEQDLSATMVAEVFTELDDDTGPSRRSPYIAILFFMLAGPIFWSLIGADDPASVSAQEGVLGSSAATAPEPSTALGGLVAAAPLILLLTCLSAFFSASEVAFFSIHRLRLRAMSDEGTFSGRLVASMLSHVGRLLTTILVGNMIVNVLISVILPMRVQAVLEEVLDLGPWAYPLTALFCTAFLVFFGEIMPKVLAVRVGELFARSAVIPLMTFDYLLAPIRWSVLHFTEFLFRVTHFDDIKAAPFITDDEFKSILSDSEVQGVLEEEDRQMIEGILEFSDAHLREILVPRPDVIALSHDATVGEALTHFRQHEFSRMPVYKEDLDHITGILVAKDLLPDAFKNQLDRPIHELMRDNYFVPETMTISGFVKDTQRTRMHLAIVVDEYGGTEGIVTLEDAIEEVIGEIPSAEEKASSPAERMGEGVFRVDGSLPLDEVSEITGLHIEDTEHETVAGFIMEQINKIPEEGDTLEAAGAVFTVEQVAGKRVTSLRIELISTAGLEGAS